MIKREPWVNHKFNLGIDIGWTQNIMSRISDTILRIQHHTSGLSDDQLSRIMDGKWSIKKHVGHLIDLEELWVNRFLQFEELVPELVYADMTNQKTEQADYNSQSIQSLIENFKYERQKLIDTYQSLSDKAIYHQAFHPRIKVLMRPVDLLFFVAEHDDHHITSMNALK